VVRDGLLVHEVTPTVAADDEIAVGLRLEWGAAQSVAVWDGTVSIEDGTVLSTPWWSPEVTEVTDTTVSWQNSTHSFGEPYGAQRGAVELTLVGSPSARVEVTMGPRHLRTTLAAIQVAFEGGHVVDIAGPPGTDGVACLQRSVGGLTSLGSTRVETTWVDPDTGSNGSTGSSAATSFYYVRAYLVDGEMAWSSPIWAAGL